MVTLSTHPCIDHGYRLAVISAIVITNETIDNVHIIILIFNINTFI